MQTSILYVWSQEQIRVRKVLARKEPEARQVQPGHKVVGQEPEGGRVFRKKFCDKFSGDNCQAGNKTINQIFP